MKATDATKVLKHVPQSTTAFVRLDEGRCYDPQTGMTVHSISNLFARIEQRNRRIAETKEFESRQDSLSL